jgi:hypothetical protein
MRARGCSPYPELFSQPDESKRSEKTFELVIHKVRAKELKRYLSSLHLEHALTPVLLGRPKALKWWCVNIKNIILKGLK